ncbi:MAG: glycosyltransferase family 4 protein [Alphaproteobacteria bacterium]|nr:glycosyltransferase family 4 protein [Alphaproteobacteria bacterium]MCB9696555.1 glycosyltransferase family 4 protein [Alphaproteobacteria bacterium]
MRIVQVCRTAPPRVGGLEAVVGGLSRALVDRGHDVRLVTLGEPGAEELDGVEVVRLRRLGSERWPTALGLARACRGADVIHVHGIDGLLDTLLLRGVHPLGVSTHGGYFHTPRQALLKELWLRTGTRVSLRLADAVWYTSEADRQRLAAARAPGTVEPDGVDLAAFLGLRRRPEPGRWLVLGRVARHKGLLELLDAVALIPSCRTLELVGPEDEPGEVARVLGRAGELGLGQRVVWRGALRGPELLDAVSRAELGLLPSRYEGFGLAAVELMAARVPVVLSDIEAFRQHAAVARLVSFERPERAADTISEVLERPEVDAAAAHAATFAWPERAEAFEARYRELLR